MGSLVWLSTVTLTAQVTQHVSLGVLSKFIEQIAFYLDNNALTLSETLSVILHPLRLSCLGVGNMFVVVSLGVWRTLVAGEAVKKGVVKSKDSSLQLLVRAEVTIHCSEFCH